MLHDTILQVYYSVHPSWWGEMSVVQGIVLGFQLWVSYMGLTREIVVYYARISMISPFLVPARTG